VVCLYIVMQEVEEVEEGHTVEVEGGCLNIHSTLKCRCYHLDQLTVSGVHDVSGGQQC